MYRVEIARSALKALQKLPAAYRDAIRERIRGLRQNPRPPGCQKLRGERDKFRLRVGPYRILYTIDDERQRMRVVVIAHRREAYR